MLELHSADLSVRFDPVKLIGQVLHKPSHAAWSIDLCAAGGVACGPTPEPMSAEFPWTQTSRALGRLRPLRPGDLRAVRRRPDGMELDLRVAGADFRIVLTVGPGADELVVRLQPLATGSADLLAAELPGPIQPADGSPIQVLVAYRHQGRLFTGRPGPLEPDTPAVGELNMPDGRHRMRFFGVLGDNRTIGSARGGYLAILDENADARIMLRQGADGKLACSVAWAPSLGTLAYPRTIRYRFAARPTVTSLAKGFRRYAQSHGLFKSLADKIAERPAVGQLVGATACFLGYQASELDYVGTFQRLRELGHQRFFAFPLYHINGGFGGQFAGFSTIDIRSRSDELRRLGATTGSWVYLAGMPDQADLRRLACRNPDGTTPHNWRIGDEVWPQACMQRAAEWFAGCGDLIDQADAHHFDTTASNSLMECYAASHPMDRRSDRARRIELFALASARGKVVASEGVKDWAVPFYDVGSNKEVPVRSETPAFRVVPLGHLVYHDAIFSLWWEADSYDCSHWRGGDLAGQSLTDLLYGDMPLIFPVGRQYRWVSGHMGQAEEFEQRLDLPPCAQAARRAVEVARQFARVATEEMTEFAWLSDDGTVQQTQFANGVSVIANFSSQPFTAPGGPVVPPMDAVSP